jgi:hypothetical protein
MGSLMAEVVDKKAANHVDNQHAHGNQGDLPPYKDQWFLDQQDHDHQSPFLEPREEQDDEPQI